MRAQAKARPMHLRAVEPDHVRAARLAGLSELLAERLSSHPVASPARAVAKSGRGWRTLRHVGAVAVVAGIAATAVVALPLLPGEPSGLRPFEHAAASPAEAATLSSPVAALAAPAAQPELSVFRDPGPAPETATVSPPTPPVLEATPAIDAVRTVPVERELTWEEIHELQKRLQDLSFEPGPLDGLRGPMTSAAVRRFEKARGLPETGEVNFTTLSRLR